MGCWDGTCAVSNLNIREGDKIRVILLEQDNNQASDNPGGFSYADDLWKPRYLPISGEYDDYGGIENVNEDLNTQIVAQDLAKLLVENPDDDSWHRILRSEADLKRILFWAERGWLKIVDGAELIDIGHMIVLEDVYQYVVSLTKLDMMRHCDSVLGPINRYSPFTGNLVYKWSLQDMGFKIKTTDPLDKLDYVLNDKENITEDSPEVVPLRAASIEFARFYYGMGKLRKFFSPQSGKGSQDQNEKEIVGLNKVIKKIADKRKANRW